MIGKRPLVSVVIPAFKQTQLLRTAVESLFHQDLPMEDYEVVVVDGSPDDANERLMNELIASARFSLRCLRKKTEGPGPSRNLGAAATRGEFIEFIECDCDT